MDIKDPNPPNLCARCGARGANVYSNGIWTHYFQSECVDFLRGRAEAAEAERDEYGRRLVSEQFERDRLSDLVIEMSVALRALRAATQWRPVTEVPLTDWQPGRYAVGQRIGRHAVFQFAILDAHGFRAADGVYIGGDSPAWALSLPALPDAPEATTP